jgi:acetyltransferase
MRCLTLRPVRADDRAYYEDFLVGVNPVDLRLRFGGRLAESPRGLAARLAGVDREREIAIVATLSSRDGRFEIVGDARAHAEDYAAHSEFAMLVRSDLQRLGLGSALLEKLIGRCRERDVRLLYGLVSPSNAGMLALARRLGFEIDRVAGGRTVVVSLDLQPPPAISVPSRRHARSAVTA